MRPALRVVAIVLVAIAAGVAGFVVRHGSGTTEPTIAIPAGTATGLLATTLPDAAGRPHALEQWRGKVLVLNYWATWCPPCMKEIPDFADVSRRLAAEPVQFVGISIDRAENVAEFAERLQVPYPLLVAPPDALQATAALGNDAQALPFTVILDRAGEIRHIKLGVLSGAELEGKIRALLASSETDGNADIVDNR